MSVVTNVILITFIDEDISPLLAWLKAEERGLLHEISDHAGGNKALERDLWVGAFNYLDDQEFLRQVFLCKFEWPELVGVIIAYQHDEGPPTIYTSTQFPLT